MEPVRKILFFGEYFEDFYDRHAKGAQAKIDQVLNLIAHVENVPKKFLKHVENTDGLYEIRISFRHSALRIFCFFDAERILILLNGFMKKKKKLPKNELLFAEKRKKEYFDQKLLGDRSHE
ncbi:MAG: type II toxin-antitoxin system RelE/ParE family toxin [bacterium]|nr:type II toxin-antitoxin system RelE/ParE family toxin [bacterium]